MLSIVDLLVNLSLNGKPLGKFSILSGWQVLRNAAIVDVEGLHKCVQTMDGLLKSATGSHLGHRCCWLRLGDVPRPECLCIQRHIHKCLADWVWLVL